MNSVKFRNASFIKSNFKNLKFIKHSKPEINETEGYKYVNGTFITYDKDIHEKHKRYYQNSNYNTVHVYKNFWGGHEIYCVDFKDSSIELTNISEIHFNFAFCDNTAFNNIEFNNMNFEDSKILNSVFKNCVFNTCKFAYVRLLNTKFVNCRFNSHEFYNSVFNDVEFENPEFINTCFQVCDLPCDLLKDCNKSEVKLIMCRDFFNLE
jgi:uncharacterized protein YjbI with pentapeptide repeats